MTKKDLMTWTFFPLAVVLALILGACGGGNHDTSGDALGQAAMAATLEPTPTACEKATEEWNRSQHLSSIMDAAWPDSLPAIGLTQPDPAVLRGCPDLQLKVQAEERRLTDLWLVRPWRMGTGDVELLDVPDGAKPAIRSAVTVWIASDIDDGVEKERAWTEVEQTLLLWLNANRPPSRPVYVLPPTDNYYSRPPLYVQPPTDNYSQQDDVDRLKRELNQLRNCVNSISTIC